MSKSKTSTHLEGDQSPPLVTQMAPVGVYAVNDEPNAEKFALAGRSTYLRVNLDVIWHNIQVLKSKCDPKTEVIAVIKANAYGHGSVDVALYLNKCGLKHFAVATASEGKELRENGVVGAIQVFGNSTEEEIPVMLEYDLMPTATSLEFVSKWAEAREQNYTKFVQKWLGKDAVVVKVDTGMSRNGCQWHELPMIMKECESLDVSVNSIMTHFAQSWNDPHFTQKQLDLFLDTTKPYRDQGVKVHAANSTAILKGFGTDLDFVRPGIAIYGLTPDANNDTVEMYLSLGLKPALTWIARPTMVKHLEEGRAVGYDQTYRLRESEYVATLGFGYADGYNRLLSGRGILTDEQGKPYCVIGRVSMDAITIRASRNTTSDTMFYVIKDDYTSLNCATQMAGDLNTIPYEVGTSLAHRLPRVYVSSKGSRDDDRELQIKGFFSCCRP